MPRHPDPTCPLCSAPVDDESCWRAFFGPDPLAWAAAQGVTPAQVRAHLRRHGVVQPPPAQRLQRTRALERVAALPTRGRMVLELLHRIRVATAEQVASLLIGSDATATRQARELLERLAGQDLVYCYWPLRSVAPRSRRVEPVWLLGRDAVPWVERTFRQTLWTGSWAATPDGVREDLLRHDIGANAMIAALARDARRGVRLAGAIECPATIDPRNWWGSRHLGIGLLEPRTRTPLTMRPDGFAALSVMTTHPALEVTSLLLPFFVEYDRGSRPLDDVTQQLRTYHALAQSGAPARRFPMLPQGWRIPVLMVFSKASRRRSVDERIADDRAGIITATEDAILAPGAWSAPSVSAPGQSAPIALIDALLDAMPPASRRLHAHSQLVLDRSGARARIAGFTLTAPRAGGADTVNAVDDGVDR